MTTRLKVCIPTFLDCARTGCLVEGPLNNLKIYSMQFPKPRNFDERKSGSNASDRRFKVDAREHYTVPKGIYDAPTFNHLGGLGRAFDTGGDAVFNDLDDGPDFSEIMQLSQEFSQTSLGIADGLESQPGGMSQFHSQSSISSSQFGMMMSQGDDDYKGVFSQDSAFLGSGGLESQEFTHF